jgi:hypothetical protein
LYDRPFLNPINTRHPKQFAATKFSIFSR